ncbi:M13 family metallopeptidase [Psychroserpens luteolus]|uniref:M13 family metallopeptidase n=1 Tax=Psychroserpens luteolus TaxID=2855840 RepID=UPI001E5735B2|nr:M13 family metallopeptidase [Psychroserpens luteolus]MCD2258824.1 M13 family metallopeptidase [Psychroserpens luteolus]
MKTIRYLSFILLVFFSCKDDKTSDNTNTDLVIKPVVFDGIDASIKPGDDFFNHVNKNWFENAVIADDQIGVGAYRFLNIPQQELLKTILEEVSQKEHPVGSIEQKVGDFFASGMDTISINKRGLKPIQPILDNINAISDIEGILTFVATQLKSGDYSMLAPYVSPDQENSSLNILHFAQTGLGLPDRDYYFSDNVSVKQIQEAYKTYLTTLFELVGDANAKVNAETVYNIEKQLAESHKTRIERRDVKANYNKISVSELNESHKNINWIDLLHILGAKVDSVDVAQPTYYDNLNTMLPSVSLDHWKLYLKANSIASHDDILSQPFQDASFEYSKVLSGQSEQQPRAKRMVRRVDGQIGFALGQLYVKRYFNEDAKKRALELVNNFQKVLEKRIDNLDWMSDSTKVKAKDKLYAINKKIGYPDVWRTYDVSIDRNQFFENVVALRQDAYQYQLDQLNKAPNRDQWGTTPSTVTAYYNPSLNEIVFPAGILQAPYFDLYADDAANYGGIGMVIGHEFTHAFDDQGAQFDKNGNVSNWWTEEDYTKFKAKTQQIVEQYNAFTVLDSVHLKGALTVGENTADNGGIAIAYDAFKMTEQGQDTIKIGGYTPDQRFFLSIANIWRVKMREAYLRNYVANDPHSPPIWRVNGPLMNFTPFYEAFDVKAGEANYRVEEERIKIW